MLRKIIISLLFLILGTSTLFAQCPMCKAAAESSIQGGSTMAMGLNLGILYLLIMPYVFISILFFIWYYNSKKRVVKA